MTTRKLGAKKSKSTATLKVLPPVSSLEASIPDHVKRRASKIHIHPGMKREDDGVPYYPGTSTEGECWEDNWCSKCEHNSEEDSPCTIKLDGIDNHASPEWLWYDGKPLCKGFEYTKATGSWKGHVTGIAYGAATVDYEPLEFTANVNELVVNSMMSHWCHGCTKKEYCTGFDDLVKDKSAIPSYWVWFNKNPACLGFARKPAAEQVVHQGVLVQPANTYRGYSYWVETIPGSSMYAGFYQFHNAPKPERLGNDQVSVVQCSMMLRDAIDQASGNPEPGEWTKKYLQRFIALDGKPLGKVKSKSLK